MSALSLAALRMYVHITIYLSLTRRSYAATGSKGRAPSEVRLAHLVCPLGMSLSSGSSTSECRCCVVRASLRIYMAAYSVLMFWRVSRPFPSPQKSSAAKETFDLARPGGLPTSFPRFKSSRRRSDLVDVHGSSLSKAMEHPCFCRLKLSQTQFSADHFLCCGVLMSLLYGRVATTVAVHGWVCCRLAGVDKQARCAFAHGMDDIKHKTYREL